MRLKIQSRGEDLAKTDQLREHIERRAGFALSRFADELHTVLVRLDDLNGPRGGIDKRCRVHLRGPKLGEVVVEETDAAWGPVIDRSLALAQRSVVRALERVRGERGGRLFVRSIRKETA